MLIKCPECDLQISDKASSCPHCGYPMTSVHDQSRSYKKRKMRLPNGFGQITKISNKNLRKPYRAMVTVGKTEFGKPICKLLKPESYFETYNDAYAALVEYNKNPYDLDPGISFSELFDMWLEWYTNQTGSKSVVRTMNSAYSYCGVLYNMRVKDIRVRHMRGCIEDSEASPNIKFRMKTLFNLMMDYALEYELVDKNYARDFNISKEILEEAEKKRKGHIIFTDEELAILWKNSGNIIVDMVLFQCYSGWRPQEVVKLERENVNIIDNIMVGGMKTEAGKDRVVPIHKKIQEMAKKI